MKCEKACMFACASKQDLLELTTLRYLFLTTRNIKGGSYDLSLQFSKNQEYLSETFSSMIPF